MDALRSGFSYASSELRRATKPVINLLVPILPTFGCGSAAVKQSAGSCIHELEAAGIESNRAGNVHPGWSKSFSTIRKIVLHPLRHPENIFSKEDECRESTEFEVGILVNVTRNINRQLDSWRIPFRFEISDHRKSMAQVREKEASHCLSNSGTKEKLVMFYGHCDDLNDKGRPIEGYTEGCRIGLQAGDRGRMAAHELAHIFSPHTFDAIPMKDLHPDLAEAMCDPVAHDNDLATSLSYWNHCNDTGFPETWARTRESRGQWGPIELTLAKLATHKDRDGIHTQIHAEGADQCYAWIRENYGARVAEQFLGTFVKSLFIHTMSAIAVRSIHDRQTLRLLRVLIHLFGNLLHMGMMSELNMSPWPMLGHFGAGSGLMGRTAQAMVGAIGDMAILRSFVQLMRGNSDTLLQWVYAAFGTTAGNAFSLSVYGLIDACAPTDTDQRNAYMEMTRPASMLELLVNGLAQFEFCATTRHGEAGRDQSASCASGFISTIISIDKAVATVIENYVSLQAMTTWLWKVDRKKADGQIQASIARLSEILGETTGKDDTLLNMDGTAVIGIGNASLPENQQALQDKKRQ